METLESSGGLTALAANKAAQHAPIRMDIFFLKKENILICICWQWQFAGKPQRFHEPPGDIFPGLAGVDVQ